MVYVNSKKFACESCIKGHRSSSCHHTERPLFEIKKKGRPVSQCSKCRELRKSKKFHSKCNCNPQTEAIPAVQPLAVSSSGKTRRFIPIVPALPNGLRDVLSASQTSTTPPPDSRQRVDSLLNPCNCKSLWKCSCGQKASSCLPSNKVPESDTALSTLAYAATLRSDAPLSHYASSKASASSSTNILEKDRTSPYPRPSIVEMPHSPSLSFPSTSMPMPKFSSLPPSRQTTSVDESGCTCGMQCNCPGCLEHRGREHVNPNRKDCADGCGTCVDYSIAMALPSSSVSHPKLNSSLVDRYFSRPSTHRYAISSGIRPTDPSSLYSVTMGSCLHGSINHSSSEYCNDQSDSRDPCRVCCSDTNSAADEVDECSTNRDTQNGCCEPYS